ncbi:MAG TPA: hypothetical protein VIH35_03370 [Kiritimatiellia bacterium]|jgi:hypothetical protein
MKTRIVSILGLLSVIGVCSCTTGAREGAAQGGTMGFIGGVAAGAVNSLLFGGNVLEGAVQGGVAGASGGAAAGAVAGGAAEKKAAAGKVSTSTEKEIEALRKKQGDLNFQAAVFLVQCKHDDAIKMADRALAEAEKNDRKIFALTVRAMAETESGDDAAAEKSYAEIAAIDAKRPVDKARADALQALLRVKGIRKDNGLKPCGG